MALGVRVENMKKHAPIAGQLIVWWWLMWATSFIAINVKSVITYKRSGVHIAGLIQEKASHLHVSAVGSHVERIEEVLKQQQQDVSFWGDLDNKSCFHKKHTK